MKKKRQYIHFSFDDVYRALKDITDHADSYGSVFDNELFCWMKMMHDLYGAVFSLYTFNYYSKASEYDISDFPSKYAEDLKSNAGWLKFGFHARDDKKKYNSDEPDAIKADYEKFYNAIMYATEGSDSSIDRVVRLGFFSGTRVNVQALQKCKKGILGLLTADNDNKRLSYYLEEERTALLNQKGKLWEEQWFIDKDGITKNKHLLFLKSQLRMELVESMEDLLTEIGNYNQPKVLEFFTHESCWYRESKVNGYSIPELVESLIKWAFEQGYGFDFAQNQYEL